MEIGFEILERYGDYFEEKVTGTMRLQSSSFRLNQDPQPVIPKQTGLTLSLAYAADLSSLNLKSWSQTKRG
uniref:Uncharacterized protein n=1 Tax=Pyricularia oryzae (strain P131) TaxID=1143193 RepID=L7ITD1_PYRO1